MSDAAQTNSITTCAHALVVRIIMYDNKQLQSIEHYQSNTAVAQDITHRYTHYLTSLIADTHTHTHTKHQDDVLFAQQLQSIKQQCADTIQIRPSLPHTIETSKCLSMELTQLLDVCKNDANLFFGRQLCVDKRYDHNDENENTINKTREKQGPGQRGENEGAFCC